MCSTSAAHVTVLGQTFHPGVIVCLKAPSDDDFPEFGEVTQVFVPDELKLLLVRKLHTDCYSEHYNAYNIKAMHSLVLVNWQFMMCFTCTDHQNIFVVVRSCSSHSTVHITIFTKTKV